MATMLSAVVTDAAVEPPALSEMLRAAVGASFNCISVDGDTSTNDTVLVLANGAAGSVEPPAFAAALTELCTDLAQQIVRDGEGATKFITIRIQGAASDADARLAAKAVANSPLVKTAFYGGDANWGRILAAVGYSGAAVEPARTGLWVAAGEGEASPVQFALHDRGASEERPDGEQQLERDASPLQLVGGGQPVDYAEAEASAIFSRPEITVTVDLGLGAGRARVWTCDLSHDYVSINGHYRT
jgi:glutamate N-acetyltransferase / amino-acid N-acetyltransferase